MQTKTSSHRDWYFILSQTKIDCILGEDRGIYRSRVCTALSNQNSRYFKGLLIFQGLKTTEVGSAILVLFFTRRATCIISRFEEEAANVHKGVTLSEIDKKHSNGGMFFTHTVILINMKNTCPQVKDKINTFLVKHLKASALTEKQLLHKDLLIFYMLANKVHGNRSSISCCISFHNAQIPQL